MSGAEIARGAIVGEAERVFAKLHAAASAYGRAHQALVRKRDLTDVLRDAIPLIVLVEELQIQAEEAARTMRDKLATVMAETGATMIRGKHHSAHIATKAARVVVHDQKAVPLALFVQPPPRPDLTEIGRLLRTGEYVPGCELAGNGQPRVVIKTVSKEVVA